VIVGFVLSVVSNKAYKNQINAFNLNSLSEKLDLHCCPNVCAKSTVKMRRIKIYTYFRHKHFFHSNNL